MLDSPSGGEYPSVEAGNRDAELRLISIFRAHRLTGWRRRSTLPGRPDFVFPREKLAVFVEGCFWQGCPRHATWPKQNAAFWRKKLRANRRRDREVNRLLRRAAGRVRQRESRAKPQSPRSRRPVFFALLATSREP